MSKLMFFTCCVAPLARLPHFTSNWDFIYLLSPGLGWISSVHWSSASIRKVVQLHVVQSPSGQEEILQKAWETHVARGGTALQRRTAKWEARSEAEVGESAARQAAEGHHAGVSRGLCAEHHRQTKIDMRPLQSRSEGQDEANWLSATSW